MDIYREIAQNYADYFNKFTESKDYNETCMRKVLNRLPVIFYHYMEIYSPQEKRLWDVVLDNDCRKYFYKQ